MGETADELAADNGGVGPGGEGVAGGEGSAGDEPHGGSGRSGAEASADHHDGPHESGPLILVPIVILAFFALTAGFLNATPLGESFESFKTYVEPSSEAVPIDEVHATGPGEMLVQVDSTAQESEEGAHDTGCGFDAPEPGTVCFFPTVSHAEPKFAKIMLSLGVVAAGYAGAIAFCVMYYGRRDERMVGLTGRSRTLRGGYVFLKNKYYLDYLYENIIVHAIAHPIARWCYWFNQTVIDGVVNAVGRSTRKTGDWVYDNIDERVIDGAVDATGVVANEAGRDLQPVQSGKVNQYGALLFGAAAVGAIVLILINV